MVKLYINKKEKIEKQCCKALLQSVIKYFKIQTDKLVGSFNPFFINYVHHNEALPKGFTNMDHLENN